MFMKVIQAVLIVLLSLHLFSCSDDKDDFKFSETSLKQTQWTGTLVESFKEDNGNPVSFTYKVGIIFYSESEGKASINFYEKDFQYSIDGKLLNITSVDSDMDGRWLLIQLRDNEMVLEKGTGGEVARKRVLTLSRIQ